MKFRSKLSLLSLAVTAVVSAPLATGQTSIPSVIVTVKNQAPQRGAVQTPVWIGIHDGSFDLYDRGVALGDSESNPNLISRESVESIAEDGNTGPISTEFDDLQPGSPQATLVAPGGPLVPGAQVSITLNVDDPDLNRYFSYASMVIPSNDAFVANGNPLVHEIFNDNGQFVAEDFIVAGSEVLDAGTEVNDEIAANTAFLNQAGPNIGDEQDGVIEIHEGFAAPGSLGYPDGVLSHPIFGNAQFTDPGVRTLQFSFRFIDLGRRAALLADLSPTQEVAPELIDSAASGTARLAIINGNRVAIRASFRRLLNVPVAAHLHLGQAGVNGPIVANLNSGLNRNTLRFDNLTEADVTGPLAEADDPFRALLNELAAGNIYLNIHTAENPGGELRGQITLR